jgi:hypothetical protein
MKQMFIRFVIEAICLLLAMCNLHFLAENTSNFVVVVSAIWVYCITLTCLMIAYLAFISKDNFDVINFIFVACLRSILVVLVTYMCMPVFVGLLDYALFLIFGSFALSLTKTGIKQYTA